MQDIAQWLEALIGGPADWKQIILIGLSPVFVAALGVEFWVMKRRGRTERFRLGAILTNFNVGGAYQLFELFGHAFVFMAAMHWIWNHRIADVPVNGWTILPLFVLTEFCYYWFHRASHRIRWFWCAHVVHHSEESMNLSTAMRQSMLYSLTGYWLFFAPLMLLGVRPEVTMAIYACDLAYQYFVHTEAVGRLPAWIEYVFVTPSHHRAHHGRNPQYIDRNYGGVLIVFDRLFGTFVAEEEKVDYGIVRQIRSNNILTLNLHEFIDMMRDVARPGPFWLRLKHLWAPPEWQRPVPAAAAGAEQGAVSS